MSRFTVNAALTPDRVRRVVENDTFAAFARRIVAAHGRRIATGDVEGLAELVRLADALEQATQTAVSGLRACGYSWAEIAVPLGISRQAAQQRWATRYGDTPTAVAPERTVSA
jgi:hypothetical protein